LKDYADSISRKRRYISVLNINNYITHRHDEKICKGSQTQIYAAQIIRIRLIGPLGFSGYNPSLITGGTVLFRLTFLALLAFSLSIHAAGTDVVAGQYIAMARQGDLRQALELFRSLDQTGGSQLDHDLAQQYRHRFVLQDETTPVVSGNEFIDHLLEIYSTYWTRSLLGEYDFEAGKEWLEEKIQILLINHQFKELLEISSETMSALDKAIVEQGIFLDRSLASPWYDLLMWKNQQRRLLEIELTDQRLELEVIFMDDFISLGWTDFATLGMTSSGGWAATDAIYCVSWAWNHDSENFQVSFLKHEGRHFADFKSFPKLGVIDLEYRAKLTELAFARTTLPRILANFTVNSAPNLNSPHTFANYLVTLDLHRSVFNTKSPLSGNQLRQVPAEMINEAARVLLENHTSRLEAAGALTTRGILAEHAGYAR